MRGVYKIYFKQNPDKVYIGSSKNLHYRELGHLQALRSNKHQCSVLQKDYWQYGLDNLVFEIIEEAFNMRLAERNHILKYIEVYGFDKMYNTVIPKGKLDDRVIDLYCVEMKKRFKYDSELFAFLYSLGYTFPSYARIKARNTNYSFTWEPYVDQEVTIGYNRYELAAQDIRRRYGKFNVHYIVSLNKVFYCGSDLQKFLFANYPFKHKHLGIVMVKHIDLVKEPYLSALGFNPFEIADKSGLELI